MSLVTKTAEFVSSGHPDKVADLISDYILDQVLRQDPKGRCAAETLVTGNIVIVAGEISAKGPNLNVVELVRQAIASIGYTRADLGFDAFSCQIINLLRQQSPDLARLQAVGPAVAGDQGVMTGYATGESPDHLPLQLSVARFLLVELTKLGIPEVYFDAKSLVSIDFRDKDIPRLRDIAISVHTLLDRKALEKLSEPLIKKLRQEYLGYLSIPTFFKIIFNPAGLFTIGGPAGDTGLTGRKIVVDQYGDEVPVGGGAFSGKDPTKVDRSAAYYARYVAKNLVAADCCSKALVKVAYLIGQDSPKFISLDTFGTNKTKYSDADLLDLLKKKDIFDFRVEKIITNLDLRNPIYSPTARFGHYGVEPVEQEAIVDSKISKITFFPWEKTDLIRKIQDALN